ncbi:D-alanyl-D-alanine carboxypeptidase (penicillin-binding protein 5/6) [Paenibacillus sp. UNCCL117]|uniref:D-alanyl-D-alanine carboxypeptidase family protein n=1 Tax=unclassified Paenibacillus TaxID=185978 RepID=UPI0008864DD0|nr:MULTISPECIES: D-alanyl-D-alanine carboxypeptidase family protein [unclassified Paenibacillus]SDE32386.1 D-alanyl-D-alanine carboxypeptidase (penicillin-binding protein 5/6) [Paenibacillus sp. cl123]SFW63779.1 D-alanyl-D-alanine carboxypeptidase (penicillin-binding protein 5/6) [Paenibacillus sp. UNCCL117]
MFVKVKRVCALLAAVLLLNTFLALVQPPVASAAETQTTELELQASSAILMEAGTGQILYEYNADKALPPASMAKMMTEYLVMEAIESGKLQMNQTINTSEAAADAIGSGQLLALNEQATVDNMFAAMSIYSANDATIALAEAVAGSEENFAKLMNEKAKEFGLSPEAHFINSTGLGRADMGKHAPTELQGETLLTAKDAAIIAYHLINDHKNVLEYTKTPSRKFREKDKDPMINWNWMLAANKSTRNFAKYAFEGLDGLKTGHTNEAGYCFTGTAERNGMRLISVVMGTGMGPKGKEEARFIETAKLLNYGFNNFETKSVLTAKAEIDSLKTVNIKKGVQLEVPVVTQTGLNLIVKKGTPADQFQVTTEVVEESKRIAPIEKGQVVGVAKVNYQNKEYSVNLITTDPVEKAGWFRLFFRAIKEFFVDTFTGAKSS